MRKLANELSEVSSISYLDCVGLTDRLLAGGIKQCLLVACADMGTSLPYVCGMPKVNLLIFQNFGHTTSQRGIEAFLSKTVTDLVVYGHSDCEFLRFLSQPERQGDSTHMLLSSHFKSESELLVQQYNSLSEIDEQAKWKALSQWLVMRELQSALANPKIQRRADTGKLKLHGWVHDAENRILEVFDPERRKFVVERAARLNR